MIINNLHWKITINDNLNENIFGTTNYATQTIYLNPTCVMENIKRTLLHEVVHAFLYSYGLHCIESFDKETICEFISHNLFNITEIYQQALDELYHVARIGDK